MTRSSGLIAEITVRAVPLTVALFATLARATCPEGHPSWSSPIDLPACTFRRLSVRLLSYLFLGWVFIVSIIPNLKGLSSSIFCPHRPALGVFPGVSSHFSMSENCGRIAPAFFYDETVLSHFNL
jgi:hypothetical protein